VYNNVKRRRIDISFLTQRVANAAHSLDQARFAGRFCFLTQVTDIHLQHIVIATEIIPPDLLQNLISSEYLAGMAQEIVK